MQKRRWAGAAVIVAGAGLVLWATPTCEWARLRYGVVVEACPAGHPLATLEVWTDGLERGQQRPLHVRAGAVVAGPTRTVEGHIVRPRVDLTLRRADGTESPLPCSRPKVKGGDRTCQVTLPQDLPDGEHTLRVQLRTRLDGATTADLPLPVFGPARAHLLTDRPLYEPGHTVQFRALTVHAVDLTPLDDRPGVWSVSDPRGREIYREKVPGGPWGVTSGSLPLAADAVAGSWTLTWQTGSTSESTTFEVRPFTLPRLVVEASAVAPWLGPGDTARFEGRVTTADGTGVPGAQVEAQVTVAGRWPAPVDWAEPRSLGAGPDGAFSLDLGPVPADLLGHATLSVAWTASDATGERVSGSTSVSLSEEPVHVDAATEFADGLVQGFPNRVWLRLTTPDGTPLAERDVTVRRDWDDRHPGTTGRTDVDGVVALLLDPGPPVSVIEPPVPVREPPPHEQAVFTSSQIVDHLTDTTADLAARRDLAALTAALEASCAVYAATAQTLVLAGAASAGRLDEVVPSEDSPLARCAASALRGRTLGAGTATWELAWQVQPEERQRLRVGSVWAHGTPPAPDVEALLTGAALEADRCLVERAPGSAFPWALRWSVGAGSRSVDVEVVRLEGPPTPRDASDRGCLVAAFRGLALSSPAPGVAVGTASLGLDVPEPGVSTPPLPSATTGYLHRVEVAGEGEGRWLARPGTVPPWRLRPSAGVITLGETWTVEALRGPGAHGAPPKLLALERGGRKVEEVARADQGNTWTFTPQAQGFHQATWTNSEGTLTATVFVRPPRPLDLQVAFDHPTARPGSPATLTVRASEPAVVTLAGVDRQLGALEPLPGPHHLGRALVAPPAVEESPRWTGLDRYALALGLVRGEAAAQAVVMGLSGAGTSLDQPPVGHLELVVEPPLEQAWTELALTLLPLLRRSVADFEQTEPTSEVGPAEVAELFKGVVREADAVDPFGGRPRLHRFPPQLLALFDPSALVSDGARLPEDHVDWAKWVMEEVP